MKHPHTIDKYLSALVAKIPKKYQRTMLLITNVGGFWLAVLVLPLLTAAALIYERELIKSIAVVALLTPLAELTKLITRRKRPETLYVEQMRFKTYSFPSGHAYVSALLCGFLLSLTFVYFASPIGWLAASLLLGFIFLVGISRVYLGAHFPSDVLVGWLLAGLVLYVTSPLRDVLS